MKSPSKIIIIGLGLIGGSLAARCRKVFPRAKVIGVTRNKTALQQAKKRGWIHEGYRDLKNVFSPVGAPLQIIGDSPHKRGLSPFVFVILCTPVDTFKNFLLQLDRLAPKGTLVTDAGSVKGFITNWAGKRHWRRIQFVGAHPMAGSHKQGMEYAQPNLFNNAPVFVTPHKRRGARQKQKGTVPTKGDSPRRGAQSIINFWKKICQNVVVLSPEEHDRLTAEISHFPHLIAALLVMNPSSKALGVAASGFLDTTRIAQGDAGLWTPIVLENRKKLLRVLGKFEKSLGRIKKILQKQDSASLRRFLKHSQTRRVLLEKVR